MDLQVYRQNLENVRRVYELYVANGANVHKFNSLYAKAINVLALAERDLYTKGFVPAEREAEIKRRFHDVCEYVGRIFSCLG